jgi:hypothetical protein
MLQINAVDGLETRYFGTLEGLTDSVCCLLLCSLTIWYTPVTLSQVDIPHLLCWIYISHAI